jgi:hypothetical protein
MFSRFLAASVATGITVAALSVNDVARADIVSPLDVPGTVLWLDADQFSSFSLTGSLNGTDVSQWDDRSGLGHHAKQTDASSRPQLVPTADGQHSMIRLDGGNDYLGAGNLSDQPDTTVLYVGSSAGGGRAFNYFVDTGWGWGTWYHSNRVELYADIAGDDNRDVSYFFDPSTAHVATAMLNDSRENKLWINGDASTGTHVDDADLAGRNPFPFFIGQRGEGPGGDTQFFDGAISEMIVYDRTLSDAERQDVEAYLTEKWLTPRDDLIAFAGFEDGATGDFDYATTLSFGNGAAEEVADTPASGERSLRYAADGDTEMVTTFDTLDLTGLCNVEASLWWTSPHAAAFDGADSLLIEVEYDGPTPGTLTLLDLDENGMDANSAFERVSAIIPSDATSAFLRITARVSEPGNEDVFIDNVMFVHQIPEPSTLALAALGVVGLFFCRRRRRG